MNSLAGFLITNAAGLVLINRRRALFGGENSLLIDFPVTVFGPLPAELVAWVTLRMDGVRRTVIGLTRAQLATRGVRDAPGVKQAPG